jgi:hypothetical protein
MPKKKYIAAGLIAAGSAAAVTAYAVRRRRDKAVDKELAGILDEVDPSAAATAAYQDVMAAQPVEAKADPANPA